MKRFDFRTILERLPLVVYVDALDGKSTPLYVSPQIAHLLGYTPEEWIADPDLFLDSLHPDDRERVVGEIELRNREGRSSDHEDYRLIARDGSVVWVRDDELVVAGIDGRPEAAHGYLQDVTDRRRDNMRLELLVGILGLAADERTPRDIVTEAARMLARALGDVNVTYVEIMPERTLHARYTTASHGPLHDVLEIPGYLDRLDAGPIVIDDVADAAWLEPVREDLERYNVRSVVDIPLRRDGRLAGVLWFNTPAPRRWSMDEVSMLSEVAEQLASVLTGAEAREQRRRAEQDLRNRDAILEAVSRSAEGFLAHPDLDSALDDLVLVLGEATRSSRAYIFENVPGDGGSPFAIRRTFWCEPGWEATVDDPRLGHLRPAPHFPRWADELGRGATVTGVAAGLPADEREALALLSALAFVAVPVFVDDAWWGFIGLEDCEREREWSAAETDALRAAAGLVAAAVGRERTERDLRRRDAILQAVSHAAEDLVAEPRWHTAAGELLEQLGLAAGTSRAYLFECSVRADGKRTASQRFEWVADGVTAELANPELQDLCFEEAGLARLEHLLGRNGLFATDVRDLPPEERAIFESQEIRSIAAVPIFVEGEWWGFIGFDDCTSERAWSDAELDALRTAASLFAAAIARERSEATLREHEQKLRAVFETALDAIFITDDERRYVDVNPAGCYYLGVTRAELLGRRIEEFLPPERLETVEEDWDVYLTSGPAFEEWETQRADGEIRVAEASTHPGFMPGLNIAFLRDVTDRKRLEAELLNAQKLESLGRLAGGVAHDFNNLLTGITGYASLLLERTNGDGELSRDLGEIKRAADRAAELTRQLLAFGRRQVLQPRPLDLNAVVADVTPLLERLLGEDVAVDVRPEPDLGTVRADPGQIEQVIINLAVNAREAMPAGGTLTIATRNAEDGHVEMVFTDSGVGMDDETIAQIFEPFFTTRDQGVGLGLASVHGIVHQSGGVVAVVSEPDAGSSFTVRLPRVQEEAVTPLPEPEQHPRLGSETILLVEDEDVVRDLARRVLERQGYTVLACAGGEEAVALAERHEQPIDLLLTDVVMPGLRGYEVAERVSASRPEIKVLYMSGYAEETLVGRSSVAGSALIEKPFAVEALAQRVRDALES